MTDLRRLVVMRHARAGTHAGSDRERSLTSAGRRDALAAGKFMGSIGIRPDHVVVSDAARTRQTWELVSEGCGLDGALVFSDEVYKGTAGSVLELLRELSDVGTVVLVGHNPTVAQLVSGLDDGSGDSDAAAVVAGGFPPGAVAVLEVTSAWSDLGPGTVRLVQAFTPAERE